MRYNKKTVFIDFFLCLLVVVYSETSHMEIIANRSRKKNRFVIARIKTRTFIPVVVVVDCDFCIIYYKYTYTYRLS